MADAAILFAVEKLGDALINKLQFLKGVEDQVRWLKDELISMQCFLKDAAEKQSRNESIRKWISDVRDVAQDAEDAIEIFTLNLDRPTRKRDLVRKWAGYPSHLSHLNKVGKQIQSIKSRLDEIAKRRERYGIQNLGEVRVESSSRNTSDLVELQRRRAFLLRKDKDVVGLDEDTNKILDEVILDKRKTELSIAAIVGMGGIGKSTLARKIYNHPSIGDRFEERAWVVVSNEFEAEDILKEIIQQLSLSPDKCEEQKESLKKIDELKESLRRQTKLQEMLLDRLQGKRFFIVLDDMWEHTHWKILKNAFPNEQGKASRLLFTSRNNIFKESYAYTHVMRLLKPNESWELLLNTTFAGETEGSELPQGFEDIGREILKKCHDLPLAIAVAGGLLAKSGWDDVLKQIQNYDLEGSEIGDNVSATLELSYQNLPSQLKPCFLSLAFFKEDEIIPVKHLVRMWVVLGFIQVQQGGEETVEERASWCLDQLINRNLVQVKSLNFSDRVIRKCGVHDLLRELSIKKAKEEIGFDNDGSSSSQLSKPRHCVVGDNSERLIQFEKKHIRSLFLVHVSSPSYLKGMELLRYLDVEGDIFETLPPKVGELIGLRYLILRGTNDVRLPRWLDILKNLDILDIRDCHRVIFPDVDNWKMNSVRHFYIHRHAETCVMKKSSWRNLETLLWIKESDLDKFNFSNHISKLGITKEYGLERNFLESLCATRKDNLVHLTSLKLRRALINLTPSASVDVLLPSLTHLTLSKIHTSDVKKMMHQLSKLPNLLVLKLKRVRFYSKIMSIGGFRRLKILHLTDLPWLCLLEIKEGGMPHLQQLQIFGCPGLRDIDMLKERIKPAELIILD